MRRVDGRAHAAPPGPVGPVGTTPGRFYTYYRRCGVGCARGLAAWRPKAPMDARRAYRTRREDGLLTFIVGVTDRTETRPDPRPRPHAALSSLGSCRLKAV